MEFTELDIYQIEERCRDRLREDVLCAENEEDDVGAYVLMLEGVNLLARALRQLINSEKNRHEAADECDDDTDVDFGLTLD